MKEYIRDDFEGYLGHLVEECGEFLAAAGKAWRWGWHSVNPDVSPEQQQSNLRWLQMELADLKEAIERFEKCIEEGRLPDGIPTSRR